MSHLPLDPFSRRTLLKSAAGAAALWAAPVRAATPAATSPAKSPITNQWGQAPLRKKIATQTSTIFRGQHGYGYSHQAQLTSHAGVLYATWSLGVRDEEDPGERMVLSISRDQGATWTDPIFIAHPYRGTAAMSVVVSSGLRVVGDELIAYYGQWERTAKGVNPDGSRNQQNGAEIFTRTNTHSALSRDGGQTWIEHRLICPNVANYMTPFQTSTGRVILPGHLTFPYTDDPTGRGGWRFAGVPGLASDAHDIYFNMQSLNAQAGTGELYNEACVFEPRPGLLRAMLRNEKVATQRLGVSESRDDGLTWSPPQLTDYTDNVCRAHFGRLPDGRCFGLNCPVPRGRNTQRTPALLALSTDGEVFDQHYILGDDPEEQQRMPGLYKHGRYGYPFLHVMGDQGFMISSRNKEDIEVARFPLAALD